MRKEFSVYIKSKEKRGYLFYVIILLLVFFFFNAFFIYRYNIGGTYFSVIKRVIPYPGLVVGNNYIAYSKYDVALALNKKIYESVYKLGFGSSEEGRKNLEALKKKTKEDIVNDLVIDGLLEGLGDEVSRGEVEKEYQKIIEGISEEDDLGKMLKQVVGLDESNIRELIRHRIAREKIKSYKLYRAKLKVISIKISDISSVDEWAEKEELAKKIYEEASSSQERFDFYYNSEENKKDSLVENFGRRYYFSEDVPLFLRDIYYGAEEGVVNGYIKGDVGFYIAVVSDKAGEFKGTFEEYMEKQKDNVRILDFIR